MLSRKFKEYFPNCVKKSIRKLKYIGQDIVAYFQGSREDMIPPQRLTFTGAGDFKSVGDAFLRHFIEIGGLRQNDKVLDIGSGIGRMAASLTKYLSADGSYDGFDIVPHGIEWCQKNITSKYPRFHFQLADIRNKEYNSRGKVEASEFRFPYEGNVFDFVFLTSVFTHMLPDEVKRYFSEISRVLKDGGTLFGTFFLINEESRECLESGTSSQKFQRQDDYWTTDKKVPETAVAYNEDFIKNLYETNNLSIKIPVHFGSWCGRKDFLSYQDIIVAKKLE
jgi:SAM-dependent methyltransferase